MRPSFTRSGIALGVLILASCGDDGGGSGGGGAGAVGPQATSSAAAGGPCEPSIASIQTTVFQASCAASSCHDADDPAVGLDLVSAGVEARLVDQPAASCEALLVAAGDPDASFLVQKIDGSDPACGAPMPMGAVLDEASVACVRAWIEGLETGCETCGTAGCVDLAADPAHCGSCDTVCPDGAACEGGCRCPSGREACAGACTDVGSDPDNCGSCGHGCPPAQVCDGGSCSSSCSGELMACDGACVDLTSDPAHCGDCATDCGADGACAAGECVCAGGGDPATDPANCGTCGNACAPGQDCVGGRCTCGASSVSFEADVQPIFTGSCATTGCHKGAQAKEGLKLTAGDAHDAIVDVPSEQCSDGRLRVAPFEPSESYLMDKLLGVDLCFGSRMPKIAPLPASEIQVIADWICAGAPRN